MKVFKDVPINRLLKHDIIRPVTKLVVTKSDKQNTWVNGVQISNNDFYLLFGDWEIERRNDIELLNDLFKEKTKEFDSIQKEYNGHIDSFHRRYVVTRRNPDDDIEDPHKK